ncbi:hypothetical protein ABG794_17865 [Enterobacter soli]|uniref:hypothetical protein n=1 Tax=Enterobacter soli TaxID=885040 RepID=UPI00325B22D6|nr:hypothetical protein [Enterobacter soli]
MNKFNNSVEMLHELVFKKPSSREGFIGLITMVIYSKDIFVKNEDVAMFVKNVFGISFLDYVIRSRTLLCARVTRSLVSMSEDDIKESASKVSIYFGSDKYISQYNEMFIKHNKNIIKNKSNANRDVGTWISALLKKDKK